MKRAVSFAIKQHRRGVFARRFASGTNAQQEQHDDAGATTHFGYQTVGVHEKNEKIRDVFETVAEKYDLMNDVMSMGIHRLWKDAFLQRLGPSDGTKLLDMAGGTGDIAFRFLDHVKNEQLKDCHVTISDINEAMLGVGKIRANRAGYDEKLIRWQQANGEELPFEDGQFSAYTVAFGLRNFTNVDKALSEAYRVLQPGGRFMCLEFSQLEYQTAQWFYDQYSFQMIPLFGQLLVGQWQPYQYLVESIRKFPNQEQFKTMIEMAGFRQVTYENMTLGIVAIHSGYKL